MVEGICVKRAYRGLVVSPFAYGSIVLSGLRYLTIRLADDGTVLGVVVET
jgi:hypothetical protein